MAGLARTIDQVPQRQHNEDRLRRADSWYRRSEEATSDAEKFIFLWISFNAAYGVGVTYLDSDERPEEIQAFKDFLQKIVDRDDGQALANILWKGFSEPVRILFDNHYVFHAFWQAVSGSPKGDDWEGKFDRSRRRLFRAMQEQDVHSALVEVFLRLYTLRNQLFHGGASFSGGWGRDQVRDGARIMEALVPLILGIMRADIDANPETDVWGLIAYPRINYE